MNVIAEIKGCELNGKHEFWHSSVQAALFILATKCVAVRKLKAHVQCKK